MKNAKNLLIALVAGGGLLTAGALALAHPGSGGKGHRGMSLERLDTDGDGAVSLPELRARAEQRFARRVAKLDADQDGVITPEEHAALAAKMKAKGRERRHARMTRRAPDGPMSVEALHAKHLARVERRFARMDADGDGLVSAEELEAAKARRRARREAPGGAR